MKAEFIRTILYYCLFSSIGIVIVNGVTGIVIRRLFRVIKFVYAFCGLLMIHVIVNELMGHTHWSGDRFLLLTIFTWCSTILIGSLYRFSRLFSCVTVRVIHQARQRAIIINHEIDDLRDAWFPRSRYRIQRE